MLSLSMLFLSLTFINSWNLCIVLLPIIMLYMLSYMFNPMLSPVVLNSMTSMDPMSTILISLTLWISTLMLVTSTKLKHYNSSPKLFLMSCLTLNMILMLAFSTNSFLSFYIMFEASLIPTLFIIISWGYQPERLEASMYLMLYTVTSSLPLLAAILLMYFNFYSPMMFIKPQNLSIHLFLAMSMLLAFLVKMPLYTLHLWLPKAHVEAPVAGSMILASILLKLGGYGMLRLIILFPQTTLTLTNIIMPLSATGAALTAILCMRQIDMKSLIAYSSVSHMAFVICGIFSMNSWGWSGAMTMMLAHGLISSGLFAMANMYYENTNSRNIMLNSGMGMIAPSMALLWFIMITGNMAAPPFINLLSEIILITSTTAMSFSCGMSLLVCSLFTVIYSMILFTSLHHGPMKKSTNFVNIKPIFFTVSGSHAVPPLIMIFMSSHITLWL